MELITAALPSRETPSKKRITIDSSVFKCLTFLARAVKSYIINDISNILEPMFATGLTPSLTICLRELAAIPELKQSISLGLLGMLYKILMNKPLRHPGMPRHLPSNVLFLGSMSETTDTASIVLALHTLGTFDFEGNLYLMYYIVYYH